MTWNEKQPTLKLCGLWEEGAVLCPLGASNLKWASWSSHYIPPTCQTSEMVPAF